MEHRHVFLSDLGWMGMVFTSKGLLRLVFDQPTEQLAWESVGERSAVDADEMRFAKELEDRLHAYARGEQTSLQNVLVDWSGLTPFQQRVLRACRRIPWGVTRTYADLAGAVGSPKAARAVGGVMSRNRVPLVIPCHRVIASNGGLGGFSSRSGLKMKRRLLQLERPRAVA